MAVSQQRHQLGPRNRGLQTLQFFQLVSHPTARPVILAKAPGQRRAASDGSGSWLEISQGDGCYVSINPASGDVVPRMCTYCAGETRHQESRAGIPAAGFTGIQRSAQRRDRVVLELPGRTHRIDAQTEPNKVHRSHR